MTATQEAPAVIRARRPVLVWVISICYFLLGVWMILFLVLIFADVIPVNQAQKHSLTIVDYGLTLVINTLNLAGAVFLFLLKKPAFHLFIGAFSAGMVSTVYQTFEKNWVGASSGPTLAGVIIGWGISIAVIVYSKRLISRGVLK